MPNSTSKPNSANEPNNVSDADQLWSTIAAERRRLADELATLTADQLAVTSQCQAWTVRDLAAHLVTPFVMSTPKFVFTLIKNRKNFDKTMIDLAAGTAGRYTTEELIELLRTNAENRWTPPGEGPNIPLAEIVVHGQDIRRPLGLPTTVPTEVLDQVIKATGDHELADDYARRVGVSATRS